MKRQEGQDCSLLGAPDRQRHAPFYCLELAEKPYLHTSTLRPSAPPAPEQPTTALRSDLSATAVPPQALGALCFKPQDHRGAEIPHPRRRPMSPPPCEPRQPSARRWTKCGRQR